MKVNSVSANHCGFRIKSVFAARRRARVSGVRREENIMRQVSPLFAIFRRDGRKSAAAAGRPMRSDVVHNPPGIAAASIIPRFLVLIPAKGIDNQENGCIIYEL